MAGIIDIMNRARSLRQETALNSITPERAGGIMYDTLDYINQSQLQAANPLVISKIYDSVASMEADADPVSDLTGKALKPGQVVVIVTGDPDDPDDSVIYRYNGTEEGVSSWTAVGKLGGVAPYLEGYLYVGVATPATDPDTANITQKVFYRATEPGTYTDFDGLVVNDGEVCNLKWNGSAWSKEVTGAATKAELTELGHEVSEMNLGELIDAGIIEIEIGSMGSGGGNIENDTRLRSAKAFAPPKSAILLPSGYLIDLVCYYSAWTDASTFTLAQAVNMSVSSYEFNQTYPFVRFRIRNTAGTAISRTDFLKNFPLVSPKIEALTAEVHRVAIPITQNGAYITLSGGIGTTIPAATSSSNYSYAIAPVNPGDAVYVNYTEVSSSYRGWAFVDNANKILSIAEARSSAGGYTLVIAPQGSARVIINSRNAYYKPSYYISRNSAEYQIAKKTPEELGVSKSSIAGRYVLSAWGTGKIISTSGAVSEHSSYKIYNPVRVAPGETIKSKITTNGAFSFWAASTEVLSDSTTFSPLGLAVNGEFVQHSWKNDTDTEKLVCALCTNNADRCYYIIETPQPKAPTMEELFARFSKANGLNIGSAIGDTAPLSEYESAYYKHLRINVKAGQKVHICSIGYSVGAFAFIDKDTHIVLDGVLEANAVSSLRWAMGIYTAPSDCILVVNHYLGATYGPVNEPSVYIEGVTQDGFKLMQLEDTIGYYSLPSFDIKRLYGTEDFSLKVNNMVEQSGANNVAAPLQLLWFSDIHGDGTRLSRLMEFYKLYQPKIDDILHGGDEVSQQYSDGIAFWTGISGTEDILNTIGNHDTAKNDGSYDWWYYAGADAYARYIGPYISNWGVTHDGNTSHCYYYKDYTAKGVRLIVLDGMVMASDQAHYDPNQITWFEATLASAKTAGLAVVVSIHYAPKHGNIDTSFCNAVGHSGGQSYSELDVFKAAVDAFQTDEGEFVCWLCGDSHINEVGLVTGYPNQLSITIGAAVMRTNTDVYRANGVKAQDLFNLVAIDPAVKFVKLLRVGADYDCAMQHADTFCYDYANHELIVG